MLYVLSAVEHTAGETINTIRAIRDALTTGGLLYKHRVGRSNYYVNVAWAEILAQVEESPKTLY